MRLATALHDLLDRPPRNIAGGDLVARVLTTAILLWLTGLIAAGSGISYPALKIWLLTAAEVGLVSVMLGLFLRATTHFAGLQLLAASLSMLWLVSHQLPWLAIGVGLVFVGVDLINIVTRRSRLNTLLAVRAPRQPAARSLDSGGFFE